MMLCLISLDIKFFKFGLNLPAYLTDNLVEF